jgi:hypothetical protein
VDARVRRKLGLAVLILVAGCAAAPPEPAHPGPTAVRPSTPPAPARPPVKWDQPIPSEEQPPEPPPETWAPEGTVKRAQQNYNQAVGKCQQIQAMNQLAQQGGFPFDPTAVTLCMEQARTNLDLDLRKVQH